MKQTDEVRLWRAVAVGAAALLLASCDLFVGSEERLDRAEALLAKGSYAEAMVEIQNAGAGEPDNARGKLLYARAALQLGNLDIAQNALHDAEVAKASRPEVGALRSKLLLMQGKYSELLSELDAKSLAQDDLTMRSLRIQALAGLGRCNELIELYRESKFDAALQAPRIARAECYARHNNPGLARSELEAAAKASDSSAETWLALGRLRQSMGDPSAAEEAWKNASRLAPGQLSVQQQATVYASLADLQVARGEIEQVRATHRKLVELAPQSALTELLGARLKLMTGADADAANILRELITRVPELSGARVLLASAYLKQGNFEQVRQQLSWLEQNVPKAGDIVSALAHIDKLNGGKPDTEEYLMNLASAQFALGQAEAARAALIEAQKLAPASPRPAVFLSLLSLRADHADTALEYIEPFARKEPPLSVARAMYGQALAAAKRYPEAAAVFEKLDASNPGSTYAVALFQARKDGGLEKAGEPLERWLAKNPKDNSVRGLYAEYLRGLDQRGPAIAQYEILVEADGGNPASLNNLAWLYHLQGDRRALSLAERAYQAAPQVVAIADTFGWLLVEDNSVDRGLAILERIDADHGFAQPEIRFHYAAALSRAGKREESARLLQGLLADVPSFEGHGDATRLLAELQKTGAT